MTTKRRRITRQRVGPGALSEALAAWNAGLPPLEREPEAAEREHISHAVYGLSEFEVMPADKQPHLYAWRRWATERRSA